LPPKRLQTWIADLDSTEFSVREGASRDLRNHFDAAEMGIRATLKGPISAEARTRIDRIVESVEFGVPEPDALRRLRANEVLEQIGTPEARELLRRLANGPISTRASRDAAESLKRLERRGP